MDKYLLDLYSDYLISSFGQTTATGLSTLLGGEISHDRITRFLAARPFTSVDLWKRVKPLVRPVETDEAVLIIDDTVEEKPYTDESDLICWHYDHAQGRTVKGINLLTALYQSQTVSLPVGFEVILKPLRKIDPQTGQEKRQAAITKQELYRGLIASSLRNRLRFRYVVNDVWFASAENMRFVKEQCGKDFVMPLKENRKVALSEREKHQGRYVTVGELKLEENAVQQVWLEGVPFALVVSRHVFRNEDGSEGVLYLASSDTELEAEPMGAIYQRRWKVEEYHKSLKSNLAFAKSPAQRVTSQSNHLFCCLWGFVKLERLRIKTRLNHFALKSHLYQAALVTAFQQLQSLKSSPPTLSRA